MKPRVMSLAVFTGMVGMSLAPGHVAPLAACFILFSMALGSGAAGALNMWVERKTDALMQRTRNRPLPAGRMDPVTALEFSISCTVLSVLIMAMEVNILAAALLLATIMFYVFVYTIWLKPQTPLSIVIGGAAGAMPPVVGWAAAVGDVSLFPLLLFLIIFFWTPAHFWPLALVKLDEYYRAGIPTLPVTAGEETTKRQIFIYTLILLPVSLLPYLFDLAGLIYAAGATILGTGFLFQALRLWQEKSLRFAMPVFTYSLFYLAGIFSLFIIDRIYF
jgi:protoheme IX farnesyltransferase